MSKIFNVPTDFIAPFLIGLAAVYVTSCGPSEAERKAAEQQAAAESLAADIDRALAEGRFDRVVMLTDSLDRTFPDKTDLRRRALAAWAQARLGQIGDSIPRVDSLISALTADMQTLMPLFVEVPGPGGLDGYRIVRSANGDITARTAVQPRLGSETDLWTLVVNIAGAKPGVTGLRLTADGNELAAVTVLNASDRRATEGSGEMFTFSAEEAAPVAEAIIANPADNYNLVVVGERRNVNIPITKSLADAIATTFRMASLREQRRHALYERELLDRKLQLAQKHVQATTD